MRGGIVAFRFEALWTLLLLAVAAPGALAQTRPPANTPGPALVFKPKEITFPDQNVGIRGDSQQVIITNRGNTPITISKVTASEPFAESDTCTQAPVAPKNSCTVSVTFTASSIGATSGILTVADDAPGGPHSIDLLGNGVLPEITLDPTTVQFPDTAVSSTSDSLPIVVTNSGSGNLTIHSFVPANGFDATTDCPQQIPAGVSCNIYVTFTPSTQGLISGSLTLTDNAGDSPQTVNLSGNGN